MYDREGNFYEFGGTTETKQYIITKGATSHYQWNLSLIKDTSGNFATITYVQNKIIQSAGYNEWVRSAYPTVLKYGFTNLTPANYYNETSNMFEVDFTTANETNGIRPDNPIDNTYYWEEELHIPCSHLVHPEGHAVDQGWSACSNNSSHYPVYPPSYPQYPFWCDICNTMVNYVWYPNIVYYPCNSSGYMCGPYGTGYQHAYDVLIIPHYDPYPAPKVMENRRLSSVGIKVKVESTFNLVRQYEFAYTTTNRELSPGGQEYYAGTMKLDSITQKDEDDSLALPPISFTYENKNTQYLTYVVYSWPHLTQVSSGYGGTISFTYTQKPATATGSIWTRQVVTGKTIYGGNADSATQTDVYSYVGNIATSSADPQYLGSDVNQKYRGFQKVTETDAASHYAVHYFFTTGTIDGKDAEKLPGREYKTEFFNSSAQLLKDNLTDWIVYTVGDNWEIRNNKVETNTYKVGDVNTKKSTKTEYVYGDYGNITKENVWGDTGITTDNLIVSRTFYANTTANILSKIKTEKIYQAVDNDFDIGDSTLVKQTLYYYDDNNDDQNTDPTKGLLTRVQSMQDASNSVSTYATYDTYGNKVTEVDANGNTTTITYDSTYKVYPETMSYPNSLSESATFQEGTGNIMTHTDVNGNVTSYYYDTFKRLIKVAQPGDTENSPSITYQYNNWGTIGSQNLKTITKIDANNTIWQAQYFDGLGRVIQTHAQSETSGHTVIVSTTIFNNRGQVDKQYVSQDIAAELTTYYNTGIGGWKYSTAVYDALGRTVSQTGADGATVSNDYTNPWQTAVTNPLSKITKYYYDAFARLIQVEEPDASNNVYATTVYEYDTLGNLLTVTDDADNETAIVYDWLGRKTNMSDPDMGDWYYGYDNNSNLIWQVDAKLQAVNMYYDDMNRIKGKTYATGVSLPYSRPADPGAGYYDVEYTYDAFESGVNYGKGLRTGMTDASGSSTWVYDTRGRLCSETKTIDSVNYTTSYTYDGLNRAVTVVYPTGETVTNTYNGRGLPNTVSGSVAGNLVTSTLYNQLGAITEINLGNGVKTTYGYYGTGGTYDTTGGYYGRLWEIKSVSTSPDPDETRQDVVYTWDANGNMLSRVDGVSSTTENFTYDSLDRLTRAWTTSGTPSYDDVYTYDTIGNLLSKGTDDYTYTGSQPHALTHVEGNLYAAYDANGNMTDRGAQDLTWDAENRVTGVTGEASFVYDGDGSRVQKTENSETIVYINQYYEKNITTGDVTTYYYLGGKLVAKMETDGETNTVEFVHQDSLSSTSLLTDADGDQAGTTVKYLPFGETLSGSVNTDKLFTGQRLDDTGLYYYNARHYDPVIGRFVSPDTVVQNPANPQTLNRYSYCLNNPLKYTDPGGHSPVWWLNIMYGAYMSGLATTDELAWGLSATNGWNFGTTLHELAQIVAAQAISEIYGPAVLEYQVGKRKEADIMASDQIWEVKPLGGKSPEPQLEDYTALSGLRKGDNSPLSGQPIDISVIGNIRMEVTFGGPGEIYYECYKYTGDGERVRVPTWQVWWEFEWRKDLVTAGVAVTVVAAVLLPEAVIPMIISGAQAGAY